MKRFALLLLSILPLTTFAQTVITDASIQAGQTLAISGQVTLDGFVFVEDGATLIIEPGTVVRGKETPTSGDLTSALIISRGGRIYADGTAENPIIFTAETDDLANPNDLTFEDRGLWGGLIVLGRARTNRGIDGQIEGIPSTEIRAAYGGNDDHDNSGVIRYVSVRHGGAELAPGDEINGVSLAAVGDQTIFEHVEVYANLDDGFEWFGGTVNSRYLVAAFCADDSFDYDEGWRGKNQFWLGFQAPDFAGRIGEHDGGTVNETGTPYATPWIYNATYIGGGATSSPQGDGDNALLFRDNAGGHYANSIITEYNGQSAGRGISVEDIAGEDSRSRMESGELTIANNIWWNFAAGNNLEQFATQDFVRAHLTANNNQIVDPRLRFIDRAANGQFDPRPSLAGPAAHGAIAPTLPFFHTTSYYGAFDPRGDNWMMGWTALWDENHLSASNSDADQLWLNHITPNTDFATRIVAVNSGAAAATVTLHAFDNTGAATSTQNLQINAGATSNQTSAAIFGAAAVSHIRVEAPQTVGVAAAYKANSGVGASALVNASGVMGHSFVMVPGETDVVFDGAAIVNHGASAAQVTVAYLNAAGAVLSQATIAQALAPHAKALYVIAPPNGTASVRIEGNQSLGVVFLRGTKPGTQGPTFLYEVAPTSVED